jgi:hypothetical protein
VSNFAAETTTHRYLADESECGWPLMAYPIAAGTLCDGIKTADGELVAVIASRYDALRVAQLHARANGHGSGDLKQHH